MALINLKYIGSLAMESLLLMHMVQRDFFNWDPQHEQMTSERIVTHIKTHEQGKNLNRALNRAYQTCFDFANDNHTPYKADYEKFCESDDDIYDPFWYLTRDFVSESIHDLPKYIEQYRELMVLVRTYPELQKAKDEGLRSFFGGKVEFSVQMTNEDGETEFVKESQIPQEVRDTWAANDEIKHINIEYSLDRYNEFYARYLSIVEEYRPHNDPNGCARQLLTLFDSVEGTKLTDELK